LNKIITILCLTASTSAFADEVKVVELSKLQDEISKEVLLVSDIEKSLQTFTNLREAQAIEDLASEMETKLGDLVLFSRIHSHMKHPDDKFFIEYTIYVGGQIYLDKCEHLPKKIDTAISRLNQADLMNAGQRIKVKVAESCEYVSKWKRPDSK
jgi:hypothetical protein